MQKSCTKPKRKRANVSSTSIIIAFCHSIRVARESHTAHIKDIFGFYRVSSSRQFSTPFYTTTTTRVIKHTSTLLRSLVRRLHSSLAAAASVGMPRNRWPNTTVKVKILCRCNVLAIISTIIDAKHRPSNVEQNVHVQRIELSSSLSSAPSAAIAHCTLPTIHSEQYCLHFRFDFDHF